jgi:hypothetical protein
VTEEDRRLATLVALFAPARAAEMLARLGTPGTRDASAHAARLVAAGRRERLEELSAVLCPDESTARPSSERIASLERGRVATIVRAVAAGVTPPGDVSPALVRLCRERLGR